MTQHSHRTAPTQFVKANGIRFAYRRFDNAGISSSSGEVPTTLSNHRAKERPHW
jgi:hypothetical protein